MQLSDMRKLAERSEWEIVQEYVEHASGKAGAKRPEQAKLMRDARLKLFDAVIVWKVDRFARSTVDFIDRVQTLSRLNVRFLAPTQGIDTGNDSPFARAMMHLMAVFAELERDLIQERVTAGVAEYRRAYDRGEVGKKKKRQSKSGENLAHGRPKKFYYRDEAARLYAETKSWRAVAKALRVSDRTLRRDMANAA